MPSGPDLKGTARVEEPERVAPPRLQLAPTLRRGARDAVSDLFGATLQREVRKTEIGGSVWEKPDEAFLGILNAGHWVAAGDHVAIPRVVAHRNGVLGCQ